MSLKYRWIELTTDLFVHERDIGSQKHGNRKAHFKNPWSMESPNRKHYRKQRCKLHNFNHKDQNVSLFFLLRLRRL